MNIIMAGGSGFIGSKLASRLVQGGHQVWILSRNPEDQRLPAGVTGVRWDAATSNGWGHLVEQADAIVNLTGENLAGGLWTQALKNRLLTSRVNAGLAIVEAVRNASRRPRVMLQSSGIGYYGNGGDQLLSENSPPGQDFMAQLCVQWEASTRQLEELGVRRVVMRTSIVLEKGSIILKLFLLPFRMYIGGKIGSGRQWVSWIHLDDYIGAFLHLLQNEAARGAYNMVAPQVPQNIDFEKTIGKVLRRPYWFPTPAFALRAVLGDMSNMVLEGQRASADKLIKSGYSFKYPTLESALTAILYPPGI